MSWSENQNFDENQTDGGFTLALSKILGVITFLVTFFALLFGSNLGLVWSLVIAAVAAFFALILGVVVLYATLVIGAIWLFVAFANLFVRN
jgi:hypothetical protein